MAAIAVFLIWKAIPAFTGPNNGNIFTTQSWLFPSDDPTESTFGIAAIFFGTVVSAFIAMVIGVPIAIGIALFISHYAKRRMATTLGGIVDLLAAVPSLVFGMWGLYFLIPTTRASRCGCPNISAGSRSCTTGRATEASQFGRVC